MWQKLQLLANLPVLFGDDEGKHKIIFEDKIKVKNLSVLIR